MAGGGHESWFIDGGFVQVLDNRVTVLTQRALRPEKIDLGSARPSNSRPPAPCPAVMTYPSDARLPPKPRPRPTPHRRPGVIAPNKGQSA